VSRFDESIHHLVETIASRRGVDPAASWSARLLANPALAAKKLGEEALETALAAVQGDRAATVQESADLIYHWLALMAAMNIDLDDVAAALEARQGRSGLDEKASRPG